MTGIKVSQWAREATAGMFESTSGPNDLSREMRQGLHDCNPIAQALARFEQAIRADERERAIDAMPALVPPASNDPEALGYYDGVQECLEAISARWNDGADGRVQELNKISGAQP